MVAEIGNKLAEKYTLEEVLPVFEEVIEDAKRGKYLSIQEAVMHCPYSRQGFYYLCDKFDVLDNLKKELNDIIIAIVNRKGLEGEYNPTSSIWRMKQLGERDKQEVTQTNIDATPPTEEERRKAQQDIDNEI